MQLGREKLRKETMTQIAFAISDPTCNFSFTGGPRAHPGSSASNSCKPEPQMGPRLISVPVTSPANYGALRSARNN